MTKKILIADDHNIVRTGVIFLIREDFPQAEIDECRDGHGVWEKIEASAYDLLILDISMPSTDPLALLRRIFTHRPDQKILILTMSSEELFAKKYLLLGVKGFVNKEAPPSEIRKAIMNILDNRRYLSANMKDAFAREALEGEIPNPITTLSPREVEVMNHLVEGRPVSEIASLLSVHISTISTHKANIMQKLGVSNLIELSKLAQML
jgi:DNA-binding NarL/FixJ family response regulator